MSRRVVAIVAATAAVGGFALLAGGASADSGQKVSLVFPSAPSVLSGERVVVGGADAGKVESVEVKDGQALVKIVLDAASAPLREGTTASIEWKALLGERVVNVTPGPARGARLPDGALVRGKDDRVELDQVLNALDAPTRQHLKGTLAQLEKVVAGHEKPVNDTLKATGPTLDALSAVLKGVGTDGPAIHDLVTRLAAMMNELDTRRTSLSSTVKDLTAEQQTLAARRAEMQQTLGRLPGALDQTRSTLDKVPATVRAAGPLLHDLAPVARKLPAVTAELDPLLTDLTPTLQQLRPTAADLSQVLGSTPALLDTTSGLLPKVSSTLDQLSPALTFLRPYTPEVMGYLSNWGQAGAQLDSKNHVARVKIQEGTTSPIGVLTALPPGVTRSSHQPGENAGQTWTDAHGDPLR